MYSIFNELSSLPMNTQLTPLGLFNKLISHDFYVMTEKRLLLNLQIRTSDSKDAAYDCAYS